MLTTRGMLVRNRQGFAMPQKRWTIAELLSAAPLFQSVEIQAKGGPGNVSPIVTTPDQIQMYCKPCGHPTTWKQDPKHMPMLAVVRYACANCPGTPSAVLFALHWDVKHTTEMTDGGPMGSTSRKVISGCVVKYGQFPPPSDRISNQLGRRLGDEHQAFYETAIRLRNHGAGIGAMAYLRRVVEDTARELVAIVADEAGREGDKVDSEEIRRVSEGRDIGAMIDLAKRVLPTRLLADAGAHNPLERLHRLASVGIHGRTDEECVAEFDECRVVFEFFFEELPKRHEREAAFRKAVARPPG